MKTEIVALVLLIAIATSFATYKVFYKIPEGCKELDLDIVICKF